MARPSAAAIADILVDQDQVAPDLIGVETVSTLRRLEKQGHLTCELVTVDKRLTRAPGLPIKTITVE